MNFENEYLHKIVIDYMGRRIKLYGSDGRHEVIEDNDVGQFMTMLDFIKKTAPEHLVEHGSIN
jgi:hypothetical protein